jgi:hypothetical protein
MTTFEADKAPRAKGKCLHCGRKQEYHGDHPDPSKVGYVCDPNDVRRHTANVKRRPANRARSAAMRDAMDSIGMKRVRGNLGGTYYE